MHMWSHEVASETVSSLEDIVKPFIAKLLEHSKMLLDGPLDKQYTTTELEPWGDLLQKLAETDPRGGYYGQTDMSQGVEHAVEGLELKAVLDAHAGELQKTPEELIALIAFRIREWCRVVCEKSRRSSGEAVPASLAGAWNVFASSKPRSPTIRRAKSIFFTNFNFGDDDDNKEGQEPNKLNLMHHEK